MTQVPITLVTPSAIITESGHITLTTSAGSHRHQAPDVEHARAWVQAAIIQEAQAAGEPIVANISDPAGHWIVTVNPNGTMMPMSAPIQSEPPASPTNRPIQPTFTGQTIDLAQLAPPVQVSDLSTGSNPLPQVGTVSGQVKPTHDLPPLPRRSFISDQAADTPAREGWRGKLAAFGINVRPSERELTERANLRSVSQNWPGPRTIVIANGKGGAGKTPTTVCLAAVFARQGGAGVLAWDNNQTRGTLGWRTEQGLHEATISDLLPAANRLLGPTSQAADLSHFVHHQTADRFDVLRGRPDVLAADKRLTADDVDTVHAVATKYYRLVFIDSGNDESDPLWLRMIDHADMLVIATTSREDHAEAGALLLEALVSRDEHSAALANSAVIIVSQADRDGRGVAGIVGGYRAMGRTVAPIPYDPAMVKGHLVLDHLSRTTQRAWLAAAAAVARAL